MIVPETVEFSAGDGMRLNMKRYRRPDSHRGPVLLVPGAGVRANLFCAPEKETIVDLLLADGWDVWLENWRASIDLTPNKWDLDQAAFFDHPNAVATIRKVTGADTVKAIIHCQGSSSFALAAAADLLPDVDTIVSNSMSLHPVVAPWSRVKLSYLVPAIKPLLSYVNPRWADDGDGKAPTKNLLAKAMVAMVKATHRECDNGPCRMISFTYGAGHPALWSHENLSEATHNWLRAEFGAVPLTFFAQMARSVRAGQLMPTGRFSKLPPDLLDRPAQTTARFALFTGTENRCFLPESQWETYRYLQRRESGQQSIDVIDGYGHLDMFMGRYASRDVFGLMIDRLKAAPPHATGVAVAGTP